MSQQGKKREFRVKTPGKFVANMWHPVEGFLDALYEETSFQVELVLIAVVIGLGFYRDFSEFRWIVVLILSAQILSVELKNSSIENAMRHLDGRKRSNAARKVYDQAAASVAVVNFVAIGIAAYFIYRPR